MAIFDSIPCPDGDACQVLSCLFSHTVQTVPPLAPAQQNPQTLPAVSVISTSGQKRKLELENSSQVKTAKATSVPPVSGPRPASIKNIDTIHRAISPPKKSSRLAKVSPTSQSAEGLLASTPKSVPSTQPNKLPCKPNVLHPRKVGAEPVPLARRKLYLDHLMTELERCNKRLEEGDARQKKLLTLTRDELIRICVDEEEDNAIKYDKMYESMMKKLVIRFRRLPEAEWIEFVKSTFASRSADTTSEAQQVVAEQTNVAAKRPLDLASTSEHLILPKLVVDQSLLTEHGYIVMPHSQEDVAKAEAELILAPNWETCVRCKSRFQCFQDPGEDGQITTNGPCVFHWGKPVYPKQSRADATMHGPKETTYGCCDEPLTATGCTRLDIHVFKVPEGPRLSLSMAFINTPENPAPAKSPSGKVVVAVTFDCEMSFTSYGFEMVRLTAVSWPDNEPLIDVFVRPQGVVLDFNTRFSGVSSEAYASAIARGSRPVKPHEMEIVPGPVAARALLCSYLNPSTPLMGHAIENDLNVVRLCHPNIIDTVLLYPHPRGLPYRYSLKHLTKQYLGRDIQTGGELGHDSLEDAQATGDLVQQAVYKRWRLMSRSGWSIKHGTLIGPGASPGGVTAEATGSKRKRDDDHV